MKKRVLFLTLTASVLLWGCGALEARAGFVPLPTTLDQLIPAGNFTTVQSSNEIDTFSNFAYSTSPAGTPPSASGITVTAFSPMANESGLAFSGALFAPAGMTVDYTLQFTVSAPAGFRINDAFLTATWNLFTGSDGTGNITESLLYTDANGVFHNVPLSLTAPSTTSVPPSPFELPGGGAQTVQIQKDILLHGGSGGIGVSVIDQAFSSTTSVPEPTSIALLGIGMTGFLALRRLFKRNLGRVSKLS